MARSSEELLRQADYDMDTADYMFKGGRYMYRVSVPTRYPDDLRRMLKDYGKKRTKEVLDQSKRVLQWLSAR